jgi:(4S)-4-hydroxy-5-phosphonooxypentane-2,3-dione isomerase
MIVRLVKMHFAEENVEKFLRLFSEVSDRIRSSTGCLSLKIFHDTSDKSIIFTYSEWNSEEDLNNYRESSLFKITWKETRQLFKTRAEAWTMAALDVENC